MALQSRQYLSKLMVRLDVGWFYMFLWKNPRQARLLPIWVHCTVVYFILCSHYILLAPFFLSWKKKRLFLVAIVFPFLFSGAKYQTALCHVSVFQPKTELKQSNFIPQSFSTRTLQLTCPIEMIGSSEDTFFPSH